MLPANGQNPMRLLPPNSVVDERPAGSAWQRGFAAGLLIGAAIFAMAVAVLWIKVNSLDAKVERLDVPDVTVRTHGGSDAD